VAIAIRGRVILRPCQRASAGHSVEIGRPILLINCARKHPCQLVFSLPRRAIGDIGGAAQRDDRLTVRKGRGHVDRSLMRTARARAVKWCAGTWRCRINPSAYQYIGTNGHTAVGAAGRAGGTWPAPPAGGFAQSEPDRRASESPLPCRSSAASIRTRGLNSARSAVSGRGPDGVQLPLHLAATAPSPAHVERTE
jgi:hypothetical protein